MRKYLTYAFIAMMILILVSCTPAIKKEAQPIITPPAVVPVAAPTGVIPVGTYKYKALEPGGKMIAAGKLYITANTLDNITGTWEIKTSAAQDKTGPQNGKGNIHGSIEPKSGLIYLDLNPDMRDNNILLTGIIKKGVLSGAWGWYGIAGVKAKGSFTAELKLSTK